jgi:hypothetical protein
MLFDRAKLPSSERCVVALHEGELIVRRVNGSPPRVSLVATDDITHPFWFSEGSDPEILGVVTVGVHHLVDKALLQQMCSKTLANAQDLPQSWVSHCSVISLTSAKRSCLELMAPPSSVAGHPEIPASPSATELAKRKPVRVTLTMNWQTHQRLLTRSGSEGRSISNLCAHILEMGTE